MKYSGENFAIGGIAIASGQEKKIEIPVAQLATGTMLSLPVTVINGVETGPRLWLSAAVHGDELNGVEIIRQVIEEIKPKSLKGVLIAVPIVNIFGFIEQSRYLPDRRDLNRSFPGSSRGSLASRLAHLFMTEIVNHSTHGIDLHTATNHRTNLPHIRANLDHPETLQCAEAFGAPVMLHSSVRDGSLRQAASKKGIPVLLYEAGEALRFDPGSIQIGVRGILRVMAQLGMLAGTPDSTPEAPIAIRETFWVRAPNSGILRMEVALGQVVKPKQVLGIIANVLGKKQLKVRARHSGIVIGHTQNPLVNQGDGIFHLALCNPDRSFEQTV